MTDFEHRALDRVLERLEGVEGSGDQLRAHCPFHQPPTSQRSRTSLSISQKDNKVVLCCHAGCETHDIVAAIGLEMRDLFDTQEESGRSAPAKRSRQPKTTDLRSAIAFLEREHCGTVTAHDYTNADGTPAFVVLRVDYGDNQKAFRQLTHLDADTLAWGAPKGQRPLYRLPELLNADDDILIVVEGEKCVEALRALGFRATTSAQGSKSPDKSDWSPVAGQRVVVVPDNDEPGAAYEAAVVRLCREAGAVRLQVLRLPLEQECADVVDFIDDLRGDDAGDAEIRQELLRLVTEAPDAPMDPEEEEEGGGEFPVSAFPRFCRDIILSGSESQSVSPAFWGVPMLPMLAGCIGGACSVRIKEGWVEPSIIWASLIAPSGMGKSPGMRELLKPVRRNDRALCKANTEAELRHRQACSEARRTKEPAPEPPPLRAILIDDATMEATACRLADNPRGLILANDELIGWIRAFDKYRSGGDDREKWLRIYDGDPLKIDRKGKGDGHRQVLINEAIVSVVGTIQPKTAAKYLTGHVQASGLTPRLLVAAPPVQPQKWTDEAIPQQHLGGWEQIVQALLDMPHDPESPRILELTPDAKVLFIAYYNSCGEEQWLANSNGDEDGAAALSKSRAIAARLAMVLALARAAEDGRCAHITHVEADDMRAAIQLAKWFITQARACYASWAQETPDAQGALDIRILKILRTHGPLTTGRVRDKLGRNVTASLVRDSLERLRARGSIDCVPVPSSSKGGRPTEEWFHVD